MSEQKIYKHSCVVEFVRVNGELVKYEVYRAALPLTQDQIAQNRAGLIAMFIPGGK